MNTDQTRKHQSQHLTHEYEQIIGKQKLINIPKGTSIGAQSTGFYFHGLMDKTMMAMIISNRRIA